MNEIIVVEDFLTKLYAIQQITLFSLKNSEKQIAYYCPVTFISICPLIMLHKIQRTGIRCNEVEVEHLIK